jgi:hypothetical protein
VTGRGHPDQGLPGIDGPVDPGWGISSDRPDQGLPPEGPVDPGYGYPLPPVINNGLPATPGVWPRPPRPTYPVDPDYGIPTDPEVWPQPPAPPEVWPPNSGPPLLPTHPIDPGGGPDNELPLPPGSVWPPLPPSIQGPIMCLIWIVGVGYRWTVIDPSLKPDHELPGAGEHPSHPIAPGRPPRPNQGLPPEPPTAQPTRR